MQEDIPRLRDGLLAQDAVINGSCGGAALTEYLRLALRDGDRPILLHDDNV